jgi:hypothetical protein
LKALRAFGVGGIAALVFLTACGGSSPTQPNPPSPGTDPIRVVSLEIRGPRTVALGEIVQLRAWGELSHPMFEEVGASVWESLQPGRLAAYPNGQVKGLSPGAATVRATIHQPGGDVSATFDLTVLSTSVQPPSRVVVNTKSGPWRLGETTQLGASAIYTDRENPVGQIALWSSSNPAVALVSPRGTLTVKAFGSAEVTETFMGVRGAARINAPAPAALDVVTVASSWAVGRTDFLFAYASFADGTRDEVTEFADWKVSDPSLFAIRGSAVREGTALAAGVVVVTAAYGGKTGSTTITIVP